MNVFYFILKYPYWTNWAPNLSYKIHLPSSILLILYFISLADDNIFGNFPFPLGKTGAEYKQTFLLRSSNQQGSPKSHFNFSGFFSQNVCCSIVSQDFIHFLKILCWLLECFSHSFLFKNKLIFLIKLKKNWYPI